MHPPGSEYRLDFSQMMSTALPGWGVSLGQECVAGFGIPRVPQSLRGCSPGTRLTNQVSQEATPGHRLPGAGPRQSRGDAGAGEVGPGLVGPVWAGVSRRWADRLLALPPFSRTSWVRGGRRHGIIIPS